MSSSHADLETRLRQLFDGRYRIDRELLGGGMSRVFLAEDVALGRRIVLKILPPEIAADVNRDRFRREISFAARLQHPHIVPLLAAGEEDGLLYYTMPYIDGSSLKATMAGGRQLRASEVVDILIDVADALAYAHREGVVHRDIKPANLLMKERHAVITDFGVAKAVTSARSTISGSGDEGTTGALGVGKPWDGGMTTAGQAIGTPAYMAPEQLAGDGNADHRVDIYALGLLGYELLCGHVPFRGASPQAMIAAQLTQAPEPITKVRPDVPPMLAALISRCLEKEPQHRPATADAVLEVLRTMDLASGSQVSDVRTIHRNRPMRDVLVAGGAVLATAALAWFTMGRTETRPSGTLAAPPVPVDAPITMSVPSDSAVRAQATADSATVARIMRDSGAALRRRYARDSVRSAEALAAMEQRLFAKLRDSVANEVRQATADSIMRRQAEITAAARAAESLSRVPRFPQVMPPPMPARPRTTTPGPDAFVARRNNLGPPRRVAVGLSSSLPRSSPDLIVAAAALRDSIIASLQKDPRYIVVPADEFNAAQQRNRTYDSLSAMLRAELFVVVSVGSYSASSDSVRWQVQLRDLTAHPAFAVRTAQTPRLALADGIAKALPPLRATVSTELRNLDLSPRARP